MTKMVREPSPKFVVGLDHGEGQIINISNGGCATKTAAVKKAGEEQRRLSNREDVMVTVYQLVGTVKTIEIPVEFIEATE